jgi:hypothetical protein
MNEDIKAMEKACSTLEAFASVQPVQPIPGSIVKAICTVMCGIGAVKKSQRNQHGGYNYASTDDIYAEITRKMGEAGLVLICLEDAEPVITTKETKDGKIAQWGKFSFSFVLATEEGTWTDPRSRRTLNVQITGAQSFQAAQSYAEKSYLRSLLKIPTGDMDLDGLPQADDLDGQIELNGVGRKPRKSSSGAKKDGTTEVFNELKHKIETCEDAELLMSLREVSMETWDTLPARWSALLDESSEDRMELLRGRGM